MVLISSVVNAAKSVMSLITNGAAVHPCLFNLPSTMSIFVNIFFALPVVPASTDESNDWIADETLVSIVVSRFVLTVST